MYAWSAASLVASMLERRDGGIMARMPGRRLRWAIAGVLLIALAVTGAVAWPHVQRYKGAAPPEQFYRELDPALAEAYPRVLGIAHNAGNNLGTVTTALDYGADVIEIDVISVRGEIVAGRDQPWPWLAEHLFRGPTLADVWDRAEPADVLKLDLKQTDRRFLEELVDFLAPLTGSRQVMISSRDDEALLFLRSQLTDVTLLFSAGFPEGLRQLRSDPELVRAIGGVSVFQGLVDANLVTWLDQQDLLLLAWTVNDVQRLNELVRLGVDGITTANLAILRALG